MCQSLGKLGHDVTLFAYRGNKINMNLFHFYDINKTFKVKCFLKFGMPYFERIFGMVFGLYALFGKIDFVIGRNINACFFSSVLGIPTYFESHAPMVYSGRLSDFLFKNMIKRKSFQKFIGITKSLEKEYLQNHQSLQNRILTLPDGADSINPSKLKSKDIYVKGKINVGYTGHLYNGKGIELIKKLSESLDNTFYIHIVGGRPEEVEFWKSTIISPNVKFYGYVPHNEVKNYIQEFDIVLLPNQEIVQSFAGVNIGKWTSPLKLFEYMAQGKPIVASDLEVLREILENKVNSLLCSPTDVLEWKNALVFLKDNPEIARSIGSTAKIQFEKYYTWENRAVQIVNDFES